MKDTTYDTKQAAIRLGVSVPTMKWWRKMNRGPQYIRIGSRIRYPLDKLEEYLRHGETASASAATASSTERTT